MNSSEKSLIVNRILNEYTYLNIDGTLYKYSQPDKNKRALSDLYYKEVIEDSKYSGLITRDQAAIFLQRKKIWVPQDEKVLKDTNELLDSYKVDYYRSEVMHKGEKEKERILKYLKTVQKNIEKLYLRKYSLDHMTLESYAENARDELLVAISITDSLDNPIYTYENFKYKDTFILKRFLNEFSRNLITEAKYREIARTEPFRSIWSLGKENCFGKPSCDLSLDQRNLMLYSRMYDNVYENMDRPTDKIINNDYMLDGWFVLQKKEADKARSQKELEHLTGSNTGAGELGVVVSREQADKIYEMNDMNGRMKMKQRNAAVQEKGKLEEHQLPDVQLELRNEAMRQHADRLKGKK